MAINTGNFGNFVFYIGSRGGSTFFSNVYVSNVAILSRILTGAEISYLYGTLSSGSFLSPAGGKYRLRG